jgi:uncharacterized protein
MNIKSFKATANRNKPRLVKFLKKFDKKFVPGMLAATLQKDAEVWQQIDCLACANCCKTMTPTYTKADTKRIAAHFNMTPKALHEKYFMIDADNGDVVNKTTPCQWLNLKDNKCSIYDIRPADCSGFPHHTKKRFDLYNHVYEQNLNKCPATYELVKKMELWVNEHFVW